MCVYSRVTFRHVPEIKSLLVSYKDLLQSLWNNYESYSREDAEYLQVLQSFS